MERESPSCQTETRRLALKTLGRVLQRYRSWNHACINDRGRKSVWKRTDMDLSRRHPVFRQKPKGSRDKNEKPQLEESRKQSSTYVSSACCRALASGSRFVTADPTICAIVVSCQTLLRCLAFVLRRVYRPLHCAPGSHWRLALLEALAHS